MKSTIESMNSRIYRVGNVSLPTRGIIALIGGCLLLLSYAVDLSYANLNTYVISYLKSKNNDITYSDWVFVATAKTISTGLLMPFAGELSNKIGLKWSLSLGSGIFSAGYLLTPIVLDAASPAYVVITIALGHGIGFALAYAQSLGAVMKWYPGSEGLMTSFAVAGYGFGSAIWIPLQTAFVNPDNISPVVVNPDEEDKYFTDKELLSRIPKLFYLLGGLFLATQIVAILLIREPTDEELDRILQFHEENKKLRQDRPLEEIPSQKPYSLKPLDTLKVAEFYKLWLAFFSVYMMNGYIGSFSKSFGQIYINDDKFFAKISTVSMFANGFCRIFWGKIFDMQGFQFTLLMIVSLASMISFSSVDLTAFEIDSAGAKAFYSIWIISIYFVVPGIFAVMAPATMHLFGPNHYSGNFGLLFTQTIACSLLLILGTKVLYNYFGYTGMFFLTGSIGIIGMLASCLIPNKVDSNSYKERFEKTDEEGMGDAAIVE